MASRELDELIQAGNDFRSRGEAMIAEPLLRRAVVVAESGDSELDTERALPAALNALGMVCKDLAKYDEGRALYQRALAVVERSPHALEHDVATLYHNLGGIEHARRDYVAAAPLARRGLALRRLLNDEESVAADLVALGAILDGHQEFDEGEDLYLEALAILEREPQRNRAEIAVALNNLGANHLQRGRTTEALELLARSEAIKREALDARHPGLSVTLNNLAVAKKRRGDLGAAARLYGEAVEILETTLGPEHPQTIACRNNLSNLEKSHMSIHNESSQEREIVRIDLTAEQKQVVEAATHRAAEAIELTVEELEQRIAPSYSGSLPFGVRLAGNHNETLVVDDV